MTIDQLGNIGEFVGSIGVVVSLGFLIGQIRSGIRTARATTLQEIQRDMRELLGGDLKRAEIAMKIRRGESLSDEERLIQGQWSLMMFRAFESQWFQVAAGTLDRSLHLGYLQHLRYALSNPVVLSQWNAQKERMFHPEFVIHIDEFLIDNPPAIQVLHRYVSVTQG